MKRFFYHTRKFIKYYKYSNFSFLKFDIVAKNFDIFNIKSEEDRFKITKMLFKNGNLLWKISQNSELLNLSM